MRKKYIFDEKAKKRQQLYRAGKIEISPRVALGSSIRKKRKKNIWVEDIATFACPECEEQLRENLIRLRPEFYECRTCGYMFQKFESFNENDMWVEE